MRIMCRVVGCLLCWRSWFCPQYNHKIFLKRFRTGDVAQEKWWPPSVIPAPEKWKLEDEEFKASLGYLLS